MIEKDTLNKLKSQEREIRKNLIIDAAERVFSTKPFDNVSMREIADEAGIATSSIYTYFPNQETLFVEATLRDTNVLIEELNDIVENSDDNESKVEKVINYFIDFISKNDSYFRMMVIFMTHGNLNPESLEKLNSIIRRALDLFDSIFKGINYKGNIRMLSHYFFAALNGILVTYRKLPGRSEEQLISHMKDMGKILGVMILNMSDKNEKKTC